MFRFGLASRKWSAPKLGLAFFLAAASVTASFAKEGPELSAGSATVALSSLPPEARQTHQSILQGGPYPYRKDGSTFGNRERQLPAKPRGFYKEYTVKTPGSPDRGARRIVCGGTEPVRPEACFYTADHYASFRRIVQ